MVPSPDHQLTLAVIDAEIAAHDAAVKSLLETRARLTGRQTSRRACTAQPAAMKNSYPAARPHGGLMYQTTQFCGGSRTTTSRPAAVAVAFGTTPTVCAKSSNKNKILRRVRRVRR